MRVTIDVDSGTVTSDPAASTASAPGAASADSQARDGGEPSAALLAAVSAAGGYEPTDAPGYLGPTAVPVTDAGRAPS